MQELQAQTFSITIQVGGKAIDSKDVIKLRGCAKRGSFLLDESYRNSQEMRIVEWVKQSDLCEEVVIGRKTNEENRTLESFVFS